MAGIYSGETLRLSTSHPQPLQSQSMPSPAPNSAPPTIHNSTLAGRFESTPMATFFVGPEGNMVSTKPLRARRKSAPGLEQVKHRRTRSGCFTCRQRRVKCDESRPKCERCLKGGRPCKYPEVVPTKSNRSKREKAPIREESSSLDEHEEDEQPESLNQTTYALNPAPSNGVDLFAADPWPTAFQPAAHPYGGSLQGSLHDPTPSPQTEYVLVYPDSSTPASPADSLRRSASHASLGGGPVVGDFFRHLPQDAIYYWNFYRQHINCYHYLMKGDPDNFFKTTILDCAMRYEPLAYAVIAFSCFHHTVFNKAGTFDTFLEFYNKAVSLLRLSLSSEPMSYVNLLTILQLASFEEFLGDWGNLMDHRNAAADLVIQMYTPEELASSAELRMIYNWLSRFDIFTAMMAGHKTTLSRVWCDKQIQACRACATQNPNNINMKIDLASAELRGVAMECAILTANRAEASISPEEFSVESKRVQQLLETWFHSMDPELTQTPVSVQTSKDGDNTFLPALIHAGPRFVVNFLFLDYYGLKMMMVYQHLTATEASTGMIVPELALLTCRTLAGIQAYGEAPHNAILAAQAALGLSALWLPPSPVYRDWIQKQLAYSEELGYIYPLAFRTQISTLWGNPDLIKTWAEDPSQPSMGMLIRQVVDDKGNAVNDSKDPKKAQIKKMRALLEGMKIMPDDFGAGSPDEKVTLGESAQLDWANFEDQPFGAFNDQQFCSSFGEAFDFQSSQHSHL